MSRIHKFVALQAYHALQRPGGSGGLGTLGKHPPAWSKGGRGVAYDPVGPPASWNSFTGPGWSSVPFHTSESKLDDGTHVLLGTVSSVDNTFAFDPSDRSYTDIALVVEHPDNQAGELITLADGTAMAHRNTLGKTRIYTPATDSWVINGTDSGFDGSNHGCCASTVKKGRDAFTFGGRIRTSGNASSYVQSYDMATGLWEARTALPVTSESCMAIPLTVGTQKDKILVGGGGTGSSTENYRWWFYDPKLDTYTETTSSDSTTFLEQCIGTVQLTNGDVYLCGGTNTHKGTASNKTVLFDPDTETWSVDTTGNLPWAVKEDTACMTYERTTGTIYLHRSGTSYWGLGAAE